LHEDGIQIAFKQLAGVGEVLLGIRDRCCDPLKRFIENGDNALLFGKRNKRNWDVPQFRLIKFRDREASNEGG
jgi:hypothetical protein